MLQMQQDWVNVHSCVMIIVLFSSSRCSRSCSLAMSVSLPVLSSQHPLYLWTGSYYKSLLRKDCYPVML